jgi:hypothetical protein
MINKVGTEMEGMFLWKPAVYSIIMEVKTNTSVSFLAHIYHLPPNVYYYYYKLCSLNCDFSSVQGG